jgi:hypothetical protein
MGNMPPGLSNREASLDAHDPAELRAARGRILAGIRTTVRDPDETRTSHKPVADVAITERAPRSSSLRARQGARITPPDRHAAIFTDEVP